MDKIFLSAAEAAKFLKVKLSCIHSYSHKGIITKYKPRGRKIYFLKEDLEKFLLEGRVPSRSEIEEKITEDICLGGKS